MRSAAQSAARTALSEQCRGRDHDPRIAIQRRQLAVGLEAREPLVEVHEERAHSLGGGSRSGQGRLQRLADQDAHVATHAAEAQVVFGAGHDDLVTGAAGAGRRRWRPAPG